MKKRDKVAIFKNVGSSWFSLGLNIVVGIFLSPFILHHLGDDAFGLWVLIFSITGYYGLFDLGIRSSIIRYVAKYSAIAQNDELNRLINTAFFTYSGIGAVAILFTITASFYVGNIFRISGNSLHTARLLFLMVGTAVALGFPLGIFGGILEGLQRFYVLNINSMSSALVRALLIVIAPTLLFGWAMIYSDVATRKWGLLNLASGPVAYLWVRYRRRAEAGAGAVVAE